MKEQKQSTGKTKYVNRVLLEKMFHMSSTSLSANERGFLKSTFSFVDHFSRTGNVDSDMLVEIVKSSSILKGTIANVFVGIAKIRSYNIDDIKKYEEKVTWEKVEIRDLIDPIARHAIEMISDFEGKDSESGLPHFDAVMFYIMAIIEERGNGRA
jgi:hypothetical protein